MNQMQKQVEEFHRLFGVPVLDKPQLPNRDRLELRAKLIDEEAKETCDALRRKDMIEAADGLADLAYVVFGAALELGIDLQRVFNEVHRSNMTKAWTAYELLKIPNGCGYMKMGNDQYVVKNDLGKVIKAPGYQKANIIRILQELEDV